MRQNEILDNFASKLLANAWNHNPNKTKHSVRAAGGFRTGMYGKGKKEGLTLTT